jgi:hypothetical protein
MLLQARAQRLHCTALRALRAVYQHGDAMRALRIRGEGRAKRHQAADQESAPVHVPPAPTLSLSQREVKKT